MVHGHEDNEMGEDKLYLYVHLICLRLRCGRR